MHFHKIVQRHKQLTRPPSHLHNLTLRIKDILNNITSYQLKKNGIQCVPRYYVGALLQLLREVRTIEVIP